MHKHNTIRNKITISYLLLIILAALAIGVLYNGINNIALLDTNSTKPNQKLKQINKILTHVYEAESFSRSYFLFRKDSLLRIYIQSNERISKGIDSLKQICVSNSDQVRDLNEITELLKKKKQITNELLRLNDRDEQKILYDRVMDEVYFNTYEDLNPPSIIKQNITTRRDSIFEIKDKPGFFNKVKKVFSPSTTEKEKTLTRTVIKQEITYDTIASTSPSNEELLGTLENALKNFKQRSEKLKQKFVSQETRLLHSDRIILDRIRNIISSLETEEILKTTDLLSKSQGILKKANNSVIMLGALALLLVVIFLIIIFRDISRTKAYEAELQRAQKYSTDLLRLKEQFVANMSHEIRTPLSAIIGFSEQLKKTAPKPDQETFIQHIEQSSRHLHSLVNNVLDLSKSNAGKLTLNKTPFRLNELIEETCQIFSNNAKSKGLELVCTCDQLSTTPIMGDKLKVKQILIN
ncbi:MAG TPA: histidine kinase dimerization/phospho-acceptor domain-containing protein, partial [Bacteroidales bacterium]|nr:histidine kinase dimerization/phospho-acceptor domain-containing protein [Bacteroidales bacterium]